MLGITGFMVGVANPTTSFFGILLATVFMVGVSQFFFKKFSDQTVIKSLNDEIKELRVKMKDPEMSPEAKLELNSKLLALSNKKMMYVMKPLMFSMPVYLIFFPLMGKAFAGFQLLVFSASLPVIGRDIGWFLTYVLLSFPITTLVKKRFGIES